MCTGMLHTPKSSAGPRQKDLKETIRYIATLGAKATFY